MNDWLGEFKAQLIRHEGVRLKPYKCTSNKLTIGIGRNLEDKGITRKEADYLLNNDIGECLDDLSNLFVLEWGKFPDTVKIVLCNMRFQLGPGHFRSFRKMIQALKNYDYKEASLQMLDSKWARTQTPARAGELYEMMKNS
jgi:lysozyme